MDIQFILGQILGFLIAGFFCLVFMLKDTLLAWMSRLLRLATHAEPDAMSMVERKNVITQVLSAMNVEVFWDKKSSYEEGGFGYQNGYFVMQVPRSGCYARLLMPGIFSTSVTNLNNIRYLCNDINAASPDIRFYYVVDAPNHQVNVYAIKDVFLTISMEQRLKTTLTLFFSRRNEFISRFQRIPDYTNYGDTNDIEQDLVTREACKLVMRQVEMDRERDKSINPKGDGENVCLGDLLETMFGPNKPVYTHLEVRGENLEVNISDAGQIAAYSLSDALFDKESVARNKAWLHVSFDDARFPGEERQFMIALTNETVGEFGFFYRATATLLPATRQVAAQAMEDVDYTALSLTTLLYYSTVESGKIQEKFNYMLEDLRAKAKKNDVQNFTNEQWLYLYASNEKMAYSLHRGMMFFNAGCYLQALLQWVPRCLSLLEGYDNMESSVREALYNLFHNTSLCFMKLYMFADAYYFLSFLRTLNRINFTRTYITNLIKLKDPRAMAEIDTLMLQIIPDENADNEELKDFFLFLNRSKIDIFISKGQYEAAEKFLGQMLDDPDNSDYALDKLAYIQSLKSGLAPNKG